MKISIVLGTRPEIIKLAPIIKKIKKRNRSIIFTGQHYDYEMGLKFIEQLELPKPDYSLKISKKNPAIQMGQIITKLSTILDKTNPDTVMVQGDTNTVLAAALCSLKSKIPVTHVESGLRSFDWRMPEEHNRITTDHISEFLFAPTHTAKKNLISEKVHGKIFVTGNTIIDAINYYSKISSKKSKLLVEIKNYILMTLHRAENVDNKTTLTSITNAILKSKEDIIFPLHPRTLNRLQQFNLYDKLSKSNNVLLLDSVGYFEMIELMKKCLFIVSDSGGIQEEATSNKIRKKVLVLRKTTDRPESIKSGVAELVELNSSKIIKAISKSVRNPKIPINKTPYGKGDTSKRILNILEKNLKR